MEFYNRHVAWLLLNVPIEHLVDRIKEEICEKSKESKIEKEALQSLIIKAVPSLRMELPAKEEKIGLTKKDASDVIQELCSQGYLTFSEPPSGVKSGLYFSATQQI